MMRTRLMTAHIIISRVRGKVRHVSIAYETLFHGLVQFNHLLHKIISMKNCPIQSVRVALVVFLVKMQLDSSNIVLATIFRTKNKRVISSDYYSGSVRSTLEKFRR
jgi:hypothetical protein